MRDTDLLRGGEGVLPEARLHDDRIAPGRHGVAVRQPGGPAQVHLAVPGARVDQKVCRTPPTPPAPPPPPARCSPPPARGVGAHEADPGPALARPGAGPRVPQTPGP